MADLSLEDKEDIAEQWEEALSTDTTIAPGTIAPVGTQLSGGKRKISWPEVADRLQKNVGVTKKDVFPEIPAGIPATSWYRAGAQSGFLPSGMTTFYQQPFTQGFQSRMAQAAGQTPAATQQAIETAATGQQQLISGQQRAAAPTGVEPEATEGYDFEMAGVGVRGLSGINPLMGTGLGGALMIGLKGLMGDAPESWDFSSYYSNRVGGTAFPGDAPPSAGNMTYRGQLTFKEGMTMWGGDTPIGRATRAFLEDIQSRDGEGGYVLKLQEHNGRMALVQVDRGNIIKKGRFGQDLKGKAQKLGRSKNGRVWYVDSDPKGAYSRGRGTRLDPQYWEEAHIGRLGERGAEEGLGIYQTGKESFAEGFFAKSFKDTSVTWNDYGGEYSATAELIGQAQAMADAIAAQEKAGPPGEDSPAVEYEDPGETDETYEGYDAEAAGGWSETVSGGGEFMMASGGRVGMQEGGMPMPPQEGAAPPMPMPPQAGPQADMANLGMINEQAAAPPQEGGQESVQDDVAREADEGDYILPYETVLLIGLKQLNRYAREAIKLAMKNEVDLAGTDLDPTDDVPIKVSNYEFHIPKVLVPFFGGGKKYLDKIREEGLALRKRLEEEKQPSVQEQQPMPTQQTTPAPAPALAPEPQMAQAGPPPMMQKGGFISAPREQKLPTTEAVLERDVPQAQQSAYNQLQALERSRKQQQQPPMVDPTGKVTPQGFAAPQGYDAGGTILDPDDPPVPGRKPAIEERGYFKEAKKKMELFHKLEPADKLAMVAMLEGRGEKRKGMHAIMNVVMNRVRANSSEFFDSSIQGTPMEQVLMKPLAFTALSALNKNHPYNNPRSKQYSPDKYSREVDNLASAFSKIRVNDENWREAQEDARKALAGELEDITQGALFYYNPEKQDMPRHLKERAFLTAIGKHHFYKSGGFVNKAIDMAA